MPRLSPEERERALGMLQVGASSRNIARRFGCHHSTILRLANRYQQTGTSRDRQRPGQARVTTPRQDRDIVRRHIRDRTLPAARTANNVQGRRGLISASTVRRRLRAAGLRCRRPYVGPILTDRHRRERRQWAEQHRVWLLRRWHGVVFSDESRFHLRNADGRLRVWRRRGERYHQDCVVQTDRWGGGSIMVWGGISYHHRTALIVCRGRVNAVYYRDNILQNNVVPFFHQHQDLHTFQQDNARAHTARVSIQYLANNNIPLLHWPALSPDLSPIEHLWDYIGQRLAVRPQINNLGELDNALQQEWNAVPQDFIQRLIRSMRRRCTACVAANGGHTRY